MAGCRIPGPLCGTLYADQGTKNKQHPQPPGPIGVRPPKSSTCTPTVKINPVIRSNPHMDSGAKDIGLPNSLPPRKTYQLKITVTPPLDFDRCATGQFIQLSIAGGGLDAGTATVSPDRITKTTTVTVQGLDPTKPDFSAQKKPQFAGRLKIQAKLDGKQLLAESQGFTVCAHPLNWREEFDSDIDETLQQKHVVGMYVKLFCDSDSGDVKDLRGVMIKELLDFSARPKEPPFHYYPFDVSDYQLAIALGTDRHTILFPDDSPDADWIIPQLSVYKCLHCGCTDIVQPNSGLKIIFHVKDRKFFVEKVGARVTVQGKSVEAASFKAVKSHEVQLMQK
jgi:hypothetical protein